MSNNPYEVAVGQIWQDNDSRYQTPTSERFLRVLEVGETHAKVVTVNRQGDRHPNILSARETRIKLTRFRPNSSGYRRREDLEQP